MSVSSLPEWKQLLLERKRREEEEREKREKQEEEKFASMPAWKRGIIQRRKAKQDSLGDREKEKDVCLLQVDVRSPSDCLSDTDSSVAVNLGSELSLSPDPGQWLDAEVATGSQVSVETIVPVHENPFIRTQSSWRKGRDADGGNEPEGKEREKEKLSPRSQDVESGRGRDVELKRERFKDESEGGEKERGSDKSQGREKERGGWENEKTQWRETGKVPCLRTIRAENIIIIEQDRKVSNERRGGWRETERKRPEENHQGKRGMKMDLRDILAVGGSVTEIRASEVLIIKPSASPEERNPKGGRKGSSREDGEMKVSTDGRWESRELRTDMSWLRDKEKERPWGQATVIKEDTKDSLEDNVFVDRGGRVSQLLSKFGEHPKPPSRSKSSDNFLHPERRKYSEEDDQQSEASQKNMLIKSVPKRSFSFSDRVVCAEENGLGDNERKTRKRINSEKIAAPWADAAGLRKETPAKNKLGCARLLEKDRFVRHRERQLKDEDEIRESTQRKDVAEVSIQYSDLRKVEPVDTTAAAKEVVADGEEGFTTACVQNTEGISFARRVPIRQDGKARAEREVRLLTGAENYSEVGRQTGAQTYNEKVSDCWSEERLGVSPDSTQKCCVMSASAELVGPSRAAESQHRYESAFTECPSLLCPVTDRGPDPHGGPEWNCTGPQGPYLMHSAITQHTEDLISKIENIGDVTVYNAEKTERFYKAAYDVTKETKQEVQIHSFAGSDNLIHGSIPSPQKKRISPPPLEIHIPRSVFYVAEETVETKKPGGQIKEEQNREESKGVERRDSWRIGKPLSRIESLREKIRKRELERVRREAQDGGGSEGAELDDTQTAEDRHDENTTEIEQEGETAVHMQERPGEERGQEDAAQQTTETAFDVIQEVSVLKTCPQLPVSVPQAQAVTEEVTSAFATVASQAFSDNLQISEDEDDPVNHVEEQLRHHRGHHENREAREEEEEEDNEGSEEELEGYTSTPDSVRSLSPLPPHPNSLAAMSRIYNLDTIGSRSGLCLREKTVDIPSVHLVKVRPLVSNAQRGGSKAYPGEDICSAQTIQRQIEQFQLKEQEVLRSSPLKDRETKGQQSPQGLTKHQVRDDANGQEKDEETSNIKVTPHHVCSPSSQFKQSTGTQIFTATPALVRSQSPDHTLKPSDWAPTPASSPSSLSPAQSPSVSPSPSASPTLFSIRSASGGKVKRGATITISPRKPAGGGGGEALTGATVGSPAEELAPPKIASQQAQTPPTDQVKKKYPTVEEIEVIGGYQNLEKSCLIKNRGTPKMVKVCFDENQLEQVCEYPSETSMLSCTPCPHDMWKLQGEEAQEQEAEGEGGTMMSKSTRNVGISMGRGVRVGQCLPPLRKHKV